ncbi:MAG: DinB family protein [Rubricoccaceae bacterium]|nr:DinB family protein [Rubricoccaceae bacterium]
MPFDFDDALAILARTPAVLDAWLRGLPDAWTRADEGPGTWSPYDVVGHLIHGEQTDWLPRTRILLDHGEARPFDPFDRFAQERESAGQPLDALLDRFAALRAQNLDGLRALGLTDADLARRGTHPELGLVTLEQLLATWTAHDLGHLSQIARVMAKRYRDAIGPWAAYLPVVHDRPRPAS